MKFNTNLPEWKNEGTEPSNELKNNGFQSGYKPPAGVFNWFWSLVTKAIKELQTKLENDISMEGNKITNVGEPELRSDVATRGFVEDFSIEGSTYVAVDENNDGNVVLRPYVPLVDDPADYIIEQGTKGVKGKTDSEEKTYYWTYHKWNSGKVEAWIPYYNNEFVANANAVATFNIPVPQGIFSKAPNFVMPSIRTGSESSNLGLCTLTTSVEGISSTNIAVKAHNAHTLEFKPHICIYAVQF